MYIAWIMEQSDIGDKVDRNRKRLIYDNKIALVSDLYRAVCTMRNRMKRNRIEFNFVSLNPFLLRSPSRSHFHRLLSYAAPLSRAASRTLLAFLSDSLLGRFLSRGRTWCWWRPIVSSNIPLYMCVWLTWRSEQGRSEALVASLSMLTLYASSQI